MQRIGLTGGIASGKSTVAQYLRERGIVVLDADAIARQVVEPGSTGLSLIVEEFGDDILQNDGTLDRPKLGSIVFSDPALRSRLNAILHPLIGLETARQAEESEQSGVQWLVHEIPLLFENDLDGMMDATILVALSEPQQLKRLRAREPEMDASEAQARIASQMPLETKRARADHIIDNAGSRENTIAQIRSVWTSITGQELAP